MIMPPKFKFVQGEKLLCLYGSLIYEAKCLKVSINKEKQIKYLIHYAGWNKRWDEWVPENRVLKYNETNVLRQKEVQRAHDDLSKSKKSKSPNTDSVEDADFRASKPNQKGTKEVKIKQENAPSCGQDSSSDKPREKRLDPSVDSEQQPLNKVEVEAKIPDELKSWLVDDWDLISRQRKLTILPAKLCVDDILDNYVNYKSSIETTNVMKKSAIVEVSKGIREYFNAMLGPQLLYKFERPQYARILEEHPDTPMSKIYGICHLMRLFVKLGSMLAYTSFDEKSRHILIALIQDFLKYLVKNSSTLFSLQHYGTVPPDYYIKVEKHLSC